MRILTHNSLRCSDESDTKKQSSEEQYRPYDIEIEEIEVIETNINADFIYHIMPTLDWSGILIASKAIGLEGFPDTFDLSLLEDKDFLQAMHYLLFDVHVVSGYLINSFTNKKFKIENSIPIFM